MSPDRASADGDAVPVASDWRDSRRASLRIYRGSGSPRPLLNLLGLILVAALCLAAWRTLTQSLLPEQRLVLLLFVGAVGLWVTEAVPPFAVGLLIIGYLVFFLGTDLVLEEAWDVEPYVNTWSSNAIWLMLGGFFLAAGLGRTGLDRRLFARAVEPARGEPRRVLLAVMLATAFGSMVMSNTSTTALMIGAIAPLARRPEADRSFSKALLLGVPLAASVGGMGTIIGSAPNAIAVGIAAQNGHTIDFFEWMIVGLPVALALVLVGWWGLCRRYPAEADRIDLDFGGQAPDLAGRSARLVVTLVTLATVGMWLTSPLHGIHAATICAIPIVGLTMTRVVGAEQVRALPWDTLMLVAGGLSLGAAIVDVGLVDVFVAKLGFLQDLRHEWIVFAVLALITVTLSNFMSNTAAVSVLLPVAVALCPGRELPASMILGLCGSCALMLPVSTPPNAIAFSTGVLQGRDFRWGGLRIALFGPLFVILWVTLSEVAGFLA